MNHGNRAPTSDMQSDGTPRRRSSRLASWLVAIAILIVLYILSAGPVLALGCWLRDATGWHGFDFVFFLYLPLYPLADIDLCEAYLMWWMRLLGTMPPG
jgi:hypothetical protein